MPDSNFGDVLCRRAASTPAATAFTFLEDDGSPEQMTYAELDLRARAIAVGLADGAAAGRRVLLLLPPGLRYVSALFGCFYGGATAVPTYLPSGQRRLAQLMGMAHDAEAVLALTDRATLAAIRRDYPQLAEGGGLAWLCLEDLPDSCAGDWPERAGTLNELALLQYTSGSTGSPKGVMVGHDNLLHNSSVISSVVGADQDSRSVSWLPPYHDMGLIGGILQPVYSGFPGTLLSPTTFLRRPFRWLKVISDHRANFSAAPDFAYLECVRRITDEERAQLDLRTWRHAIVGAEPVRADSMKAFSDRFAASGFDPAAFHPCYGLAEATLLVTGGTVPGGRPRSVEVARHDLGANSAAAPTERTSPDTSAAVFTACGRAQGDNLVLIVNPETTQPLPPGEIGEIWVSGPTVTAGYWHQAAETERTFRARASGHGDIGFLRTGDLGFQLDGELYVTGRLKDLIVVRGRNHYPQDIEFTAERVHPKLRPARGAAFAVTVDAAPAVVVVHEVERGLDATEAAEVEVAIRRAVAEDHGLALADVVLVRPGTIPRTSSGKIERATCRARWLAGKLTRVRVPAAGTAGQETTDLAGIIHAELGAVAPAPDMSLVSLGVDSMKAIGLAVAIRSSFGVDIPVPLLLGGMTIREAEQFVAANVPAPAAQTGPGEDRADTTTVTNEQKRMWLLDRLGAGAAYQVVGQVRLRGPLNPSLLRECLDELLRRHPALRTVFRQTGEDEVEAVVTEPREFELAIRHVTGMETDDEIEGALRELAEPPFDLVNGPLLRTVLLRANRHDWCLGLVAHHIAIDGWSLGLLFDKLGRYYQERAAGRVFPKGERRDGAPSSPKTAPSPSSVSFWRAYLDGAAAVDLPAHRPPSASQTFRGSSSTFKLPAAQYSAVRDYAAGRGATPFMAVLAALGVVLADWSAQRDLVIGTPASGRHNPGSEDQVGLFVTLLPLRVDLTGRPSFDTLIDRVRLSCLAAYAHQDLSFEDILRLVELERVAGRAPLVRVTLAMQNLPMAPWRAGEVEAVPREMPAFAAQFELSVHLTEQPDGALAGHAVHNTDLFDANMVADLLTALKLVLAAVPASHARPVADLPVLDAATVERITRTFSGSEAGALADGPVHEAFEAVVDRDPDAIAVTGEGGELTYGQLETEANRLAWRLMALGVTAETVVGVCLPRSPDLVVAILGILKAGGAYLPLDVELPSVRLAAMVEDAGPAVLVTCDERETDILAHCPAVGALALVNLHDPALEDAGLPGRRPPMAVIGQNLALVVYTSGTSGKPKGVMTPHAGVANRVAWMQREYGLMPGEAVLHKTSIGFDVSAWELFWPLATGGTIVLARQGGQRDPVYLSTIIADYAVTTCDFVPSMLDVFLDVPGVASKAATLRRVICNSEALPPSTAARFLRTLPSAGLHNLYGPTEATIEVVAQPVSEAVLTDVRVPIGRPIDGARVYVLDVYGHLAPPGVPGEVYLGGLPVTRGYLGSPGQTAERYVPDPFHAGGRLYRTGDLARWTADGRLDLLGRADRQVKIRGHRVEPGEVEAVLLSYPGITSAAITVQADCGRAAWLTAFAVYRGDDPPAPATVRAFLAERLPAALVPASLHWLAALPTGHNGKLDRSALPVPVEPAARHLAPRTELERQIAEIWCATLGRVEVSAAADFFDLGGDSLQAMKIVLRIRAVLGVEVPVTEILVGEVTVAELAKKVERLQWEQADPAQLRALVAELAAMSDDQVLRQLAGGHAPE